MAIKLFGHGPGDEDEFCDYSELDLDVECNDDVYLWAIEEDGEVTGYVCSNHKDIYKLSVGLA